MNVSNLSANSLHIDPISTALVFPTDFPMFFSIKVQTMNPAASPEHCRKTPSMVSVAKPQSVAPEHFRFASAFPIDMAKVLRRASPEVFTSSYSRTTSW